MNKSARNENEVGRRRMDERMELGFLQPQATSWQVASQAKPSRAKPLPSIHVGGIVLEFHV
jgi:hypothetical protein